jgi:hypothetical protein
MLKATIAIALSMLLLGCQTAQHREYLSACPQAEIPQSCSINVARAECGPVRSVVLSCVTYLDKAVKAEAARQGRASLDPADFQNPEAVKIQLGSPQIQGAPGAIVDPTNLLSYQRSLGIANELVAEKARRYAAALREYEDAASLGRQHSIDDLQTAYSEILALRTPLQQAAAAGEPIDRFYFQNAGFSYPAAARNITNQLDYHNETLNAAVLIASQRHEVLNYPKSRILARMLVEDFRALSDQVSKEWPERFFKDKVRAERLIADYSRRRAYEAQARENNRQRGPQADRGCSCSNGSVCFGPRGGRFCITSGGNKRYGI